MKKCPVQSVDVVSGGTIGIIKHKNNANSRSIQAPTFAVSPSQCQANIKIELVRQDNPLLSVHDFISYSQLSGVVLISTSTDSPPGIYKFFFRATDLITEVINTKVAFELHLQASQLTIEPNPINDITYNIEKESSLITIPVPKYNS
jgi:hypothetical protein